MASETPCVRISCSSASATSLNRGPRRASDSLSRYALSGSEMRGLRCITSLMILTGCANITRRRRGGGFGGKGVAAGAASCRPSHVIPAPDKRGVLLDHLLRVLLDPHLVGR